MQMDWNEQEDAGTKSLLLLYRLLYSVFMAGRLQDIALVRGKKYVAMASDFSIKFGYFIRHIAYLF